jgi:mannose-6-phosphate isomerase-like protein (cupin superfamily)
MKVTRIYTGEDNQSHFEDFDIPLMLADYGSASEVVPALEIIFRETSEGGSLDFHNAPKRQFVITLSGLGELECGDGSQRRFGPGDILLAEDTTGQGHMTREIRPRRVIFIPISQEFDVRAWRRR